MTSSETALAECIGCVHLNLHILPSYSAEHSAGALNLPEAQSDWPYILPDKSDLMWL